MTQASELSALRTTMKAVVENIVTMEDVMRGLDVCDANYFLALSQFLLQQLTGDPCMISLWY
jgi:hypothetical protein